MLVVSPHLDDGVLSLGGMLAQLVTAGSEVAIATLFTGPPPAPLSPGARAFHEQCGLGDDAMHHRLGEDMAACRAVGARYRHLGLPEALYRVDATGRPRHRDGRAIFRADPADEPDVVDAVERQVRALRDELQPDLVVGPLGVGDHIDHAITHRALRRCDIEPSRLRWFEDVPYILYSHTRGWTSRVSQVLLPQVVPIRAEHWDTKIAAVTCYGSQLGVLWHDPTPWRTQLHDYAVEIGGGHTAERLWLSG